MVPKSIHLESIEGDDTCLPQAVSVKMSCMSNPSGHPMVWIILWSFCSQMCKHISFCMLHIYVDVVCMCAHPCAILHPTCFSLYVGDFTTFYLLFNNESLSGDKMFCQWRYYWYDCIGALYLSLTLLEFHLIVGHDNLPCLTDFPVDHCHFPLRLLCWM